jgi:hypothetical protein
LSETRERLEMANSPEMVHVAPAVTGLAVRSESKELFSSPA